jgi:hypothetical protein
MVKIPSIEADIKMIARDAAKRSISFTAGSNLKLSIPASPAILDVRVLDAFTSRKAHTVEAGDEAFVVFLLVDYPTVSYQELKTGARFEIIDNADVVGSGIVQARVE